MFRILFVPFIAALTFAVWPGLWLRKAAHSWTPAGLLPRLSAILKFNGGGRTVEVRQVKCLNNILERDHRIIKRITRPVLGFKAFHFAAATIAGIETAHMIRQGQFCANGLSGFQQFAQLAA